MPDDVKARVASAYDRASDWYDDSANSFWDRFGRRTIDRLGIHRGARVLDLCCGAGASALPAAEAVGPAGSVVAVDLSAELLRLAQRKARSLGHANVRFEQADFLSLELEPASFDAVVCVFGVFFVPDMVAALRRMGSLVRPGGRLAVTTWGKGLFEPIDGAFWSAVRRVRPELFKSFQPWDRVGEPELLRGLLAEAGVSPAEVVVEPGTHRLADGAAVRALLMGTGYRGTIEQLSRTERIRVEEELLGPISFPPGTEVRADVIDASCTKAARSGPSA